jgi:hypothetical protein
MLTFRSSRTVNAPATLYSPSGLGILGIFVYRVTLYNFLFRSNNVPCHEISSKKLRSNTGIRYGSHPQVIHKREKRYILWVQRVHRLISSTLVQMRTTRKMDMIWNLCLLLSWDVLLQTLHILPIPTQTLNIYYYLGRAISIHYHFPHLHVGILVPLHK